MARSLKIAILRTQDCDDSSLKPSLLAIEGVRVIAELGLADDLRLSVKQLRPDVLFIALGKSPALLLLGQVADVIKEQRDLCVVLAGPNRDPDLLLTAMRSGVREFIQLPCNPEQLLDVLQKIIEIQPDRQTGKLIVFHGAGGGCGTSTVAANVGVELARSGRGRVVLVDLDLYSGQLASSLDLFPTYTLLDVCRLDGAEEIEPARIESALLKHDSGLRVLARPKNLVGDDVLSLSNSVGVLHHLLDLFDYVLVDMEMHVDVTDGKIMSLVDQFVLISQPVLNSVRNASEITQNLGARGLDLDRLRLVLNRVPKKFGSLSLENVEKSLKRNVFWEIPEDYTSVSESINLGVALSEYATSSKARCSIRDLAMSLTRAETIKEKKASGSKEGFLKRIFKNNVA